MNGAPARRSLTDPWFGSLVVAVALITLGFVVFGIAWRGAARTLLVQEQVAYLVSGGIGGVCLIILGVTLGTVQLSRYWAARERSKLDVVLMKAAALRGDGR